MVEGVELVKARLGIEDEIEFVGEVGTPQDKLANAWNEGVLQGHLRQVRRQTLSLCLPVERVLFHYLVLDLFVLEFVEFLDLPFVDIFCAFFVHRQGRFGSLGLALLWQCNRISV